MGGTLAVAFVLARRYVRRRWHFVRRHPVTRGAMAAGAFVLAGRERSWARATPEQLSSGSAARVRRRMWVAVEDAEKAVAHASSHEAPVADLPSVCRSLHGLASELDGLLRHERRLPSGTHRSDGLRSQVAELIGAAPRRPGRGAAGRERGGRTPGARAGPARRRGDRHRIGRPVPAAVARATPLSRSPSRCPTHAPRHRTRRA